MRKKINLIFMGDFTYPRGMAATKRIQNIINSFKEYPDISTRVILQRQSSKENNLSGEYKGTPYETVIGDLLRSKMFFMLFILYYKTCCTLKQALRPDYKNMIYFYGPLFFDSIVPLIYAKKLGYKIVFDVIEDFGLARDVSHTFYSYLRSSLANKLSLKIKDLAAGIIVLSSYLEKQCNVLTKNQVPIHYLPISVNLNQFGKIFEKKNSCISLFYAGSFGKKDGLPVLLDAFDVLARKYKNINLVLTGRGDTEAMKELFIRIEKSPYKNRIEYKGYLDDDDYYSLLNEVDIHCMTRVDLAFAHAGFPFKLGEFLATGKPVIASRVSDIERFLIHGHNAMLVNPGSSSEICESVELLINKPEFAKAVGTYGREIAKSFFDYKKQGKALLIFLKKI